MDGIKIQTFDRIQFRKSLCRAKSTSYKAYVKSILHSSGISTKASEYGKINKGVAVTQLEKQLNIKISNCGLFIHPKELVLAASPDGIIDDGEGVVEIKCPSSMAGIDPEEEALSKKTKYFKTVDAVSQSST